MASIMNGSKEDQILFDKLCKTVERMFKDFNKLHKDMIKIKDSKKSKTKHIKEK